MVRIALIGCGRIGKVHTDRILADGRAKIVAMCDPSPANAERLQGESKLTTAVFDRPEELIDEVPIDAAVICSPTPLHFDQVRLFRERGIPVLCEKPLADTRMRVVQLIGEANSGPMLSIAYQRRYSAAFRTLRREVQSGRWGPVKSITVTNTERWQQTIHGTWRDDPEFNPGGFIGDAGSHKIDMVFFVSGLKPVDVVARSDRRGSRVEIVTSLSARLENDVALSMSFVGDANRYSEDFHIHCAEADLLFRDNQVWVARNNRTEKLEPVEPESNPNAAFLDGLLKDRPNETPAEIALPVWDFTHAILESARTGKVVEFEEGLS